MSVIHINQIAGKVRGYFEEYLDLSDIGEADLQKDHKILTRCLAAYGVYNSIECSYQEAASAVVDGGDDNGIDAIYYSAINKKLIIVQSKWSQNGNGEPESAGVSKFCTGVKDLFNIVYDRFNEKIRQKEIEINEALNEYDTKYELIFIDTHATQNLAEHSMRHINDLLEEMNNTGDEAQEQIVTFKRLDQGKVFQSLARRSGDEPINIEIGLSNWGMVSEPYKAFYGIVSGDEIASWWEENQTRLFDKNIRQVLGSTDVNKEIDITLEEKPESFWYFNNGITVICDTIEKSILGGSSRDLGSFKLKNISIVNGAQTVSTIGKFSQKENSTSLHNVKVHIKIISLNGTPENFGTEVTKTNNRQNRIENRDFVSQDPEQLRIKAELSIEDIEYIIMRSDSFRATDKSFGLTEATVALACAANKTSLSVQAKSGIGKFYDNLEKGIYKQLFNPSVSGIYVYNCVKVNRSIEDYLQVKISELPRRSGKDYGLLIHGIRIISQLTFNSLNITSDLSSIDFSPNKEDIKLHVDENISKVASQLEILYPENILGTLFKNTTKCNHVVNEIESE
ncbi:MAG: AIPR family protein [Sulfurimonadaceae bacterium]